MPVPFSIAHRGVLALMPFSLAAVIGVAGCGGNDAIPDATSTTGSTQPGDGTTRGEADPVRPDDTPVRAGLAQNDPRTEWIGDIPYNVFFDRPLDVVRDQTPVGTIPSETPVATDAGTTEPAPAVDDPMPASTPDEGGGTDWAQLVSAELLDEAAKDIRNRLTANLQTVAAYNSSWEAIALDGHTLATLAAVIEKHPGEEVAWRENARFVRDLGYEIWLKADGTGRSAYEPTQQAFESIVTIMNGGPPPDIDSDDIESFADVIDRSVMMSQIEKTFDWLKADINTETRLKEDAERVAREASVLVAFGTVLLDEGYDFAIEPEYKSFVQEFVNGNREMVDAATSELRDFDRFQSGRNVVQSSCGVCHQKYQGTDSGF